MQGKLRLWNSMMIHMSHHHHHQRSYFYNPQSMMMIPFTTTITTNMMNNNHVNRCFSCGGVGAFCLNKSSSSSSSRVTKPTITANNTTTTTTKARATTSRTRTRQSATLTSTTTTTTTTSTMIQSSSPHGRISQSYEDRKKRQEMHQSSTSPIFCPRPSSSTATTATNTTNTESTTNNTTTSTAIDGNDEQQIKQADEYIIVYTDGSCLNNGTQLAVSGIGIYFGRDDERNVSTAHEHYSMNTRHNNSMIDNNDTTTTMNTSNTNNNNSNSTTSTTTTSTTTATTTTIVKPSNNRAEIMAALTCLKYCVRDCDHVLIRTDSQYLINCVTVWRWKWEKNGWKSKSNNNNNNNSSNSNNNSNSNSNNSNNSVLNRDLIQELCQLIDERAGAVRFEYVAGHSGNEGNEMADKLATAGANRLQQEYLSLSLSNRV